MNGSNNPPLGYSNNVLPNRVIASLSCWQDVAPSHHGVVFLQRASQGRYSYQYSTYFNRDGANADLIYIPKDALEITFVPMTVGTGAAVVT